MASDVELTLDLIAEDLPSAELQAQSLDLKLNRGESELATDFYISFTAPDNETFLLRLRCTGYDTHAPSFQFVNPDNVEETGPEWWPRMENISYARGNSGEIVYCTPGTLEYHCHSSHCNESHPKSSWKLARVIFLVWKYFHSGKYLGRGGV